MWGTLRLLQALRENDTLAELFLYGNQISVVGDNHLLYGLQHNSAISFLDLQYEVGLSDSAVQDNIQKRVKENLKDCLGDSCDNVSFMLEQLALIEADALVPAASDAADPRGAADRKGAANGNRAVARHGPGEHSVTAGVSCLPDRADVQWPERSMTPGDRWYRGLASWWPAPPPPIPGELLQWQAMLPNGFNTLRQFYHTARGPRVIQPGTQKAALAAT